MKIDIDRYGMLTFGFLQATGLVLYIGLVAVFMINAGAVLPSSPILGGIVILLLFVLSAAICALLVLGRPAFLFWEKRYKEAFYLLVYTILFGLGYFFLLIILNGLITNFRA